MRCLLRTIAVCAGTLSMLGACEETPMQQRSEEDIPETQIITYRYVLDDSGNRKLTVETPPGFPDDFSHEQSAKIVVRDIDGTVLREEVGLIPSPSRERNRRLTPEAERALREAFAQMRIKNPEAYARWLQTGVPAGFADGKDILTEKRSRER